MITFIKILPYPLRPDSGDAYSYLREVCLHHIDPPTSHPGELCIPNARVYHSTLNRCVGSLSHKMSSHYYPTPFLNEIMFDLDAICGREQYGAEGSVAVRRGFVDAFIADTLPQSRAELCREIRQLLLRLPSDAVVVSHSFRMKLIEAYIMTNGGLEREPKVLRQHLRPTARTYEYGTGFTVDAHGTP